MSTLEERLAESTQAMRDIGERLTLEGVKRDKRIRTNRIATYAAICVGAIGIVVGAAATHELHDYNQATKKARLNSCLQYNRQQIAEADAQVRASHDFVNALAAGSKDPNVDENVRKFNESHDKIIRDAHALRDCSPAGIKAYLDQSPKA